MSELVRVTRGVWRPPDAVLDLPARCGVLLGALAGGSVLAATTAARLHGLWLPPPDAHDRIEVVLHGAASMPRQRARSTRPEVRARRRRLAPEEVTSVAGLPVTTPARTWIDLAEHLDVPDLVAAGDSVLRSGVDVAVLERAVRTAVGRRGVIRARTAVPLLDRRSRSRPESLLRVGLVMRGLPAPQVNEPVTDGLGQWVGEPDLSYDDARLAIEYNGRDHADIDRMRRDITREVDMVDRGGWQVLTVGPVQVYRRMDQVATLVRRLRVERLDGRRPVAS